MCHILNVKNKLDNNSTVVELKRFHIDNEIVLGNHYEKGQWINNPKIL